MSLVVKQDFRTEVTKKFIADALAGDFVLYMGYGRSSVWPSEPTADAAADDVSSEVTTRTNLLGIKKVIPASNICHVVPRIDWTSGTVYDKWDSTNPTMLTEQFYVYTTDGNVYKCIDNDGGTTSISQPTGTSVNVITTADGYQWKFMYNLSATLIANFLTDNWLPVPSGSQRTAEQLLVEAAATYTAGDPVGGHGSNAIFELGAYYAMIATEFEGGEGVDSNGDPIIPLGAFRQFILWQDPTNNSGTALTGTVYDCSSGVDTMSGRVLYIENRAVTTRQTDQTEIQKLVVQF